MVTPPPSPYSPALYLKGNFSTEKLFSKTLKYQKTKKKAVSFVTIELVVWSSDTLKQSIWNHLKSVRIRESDESL